MPITEKIKKLKQSLKLEQKYQEEKWNANQTNFSEQKNNGTLIYPIQIYKTRFGYAEYPIISFSFSFEINSLHFKSGVSILLFESDSQDIQGIPGSLISLHANSGELILYHHDIPEFSQGGKIGIRLAPDSKSFNQMHDVLDKMLSKEYPLSIAKFKLIHGIETKPIQHNKSTDITHWSNQELNQSQKEAVKAILNSDSITLVHGPPGTGKTTTLIESIIQIIRNGQKVLVSAPSNAAVDHIAQILIQKNIQIIRLGNTIKANEQVWNHTPEGILSKPHIGKQLKKLKIRMEEFRRMAHQYKRHFGKNEREQRKLLIQEMKNLRNDLKNLSNYYLERELAESQVILGTPIGLADKLIFNTTFDYLLLDEAAQCIEPMAWVAIKMAKKIILFGDPFQLPPTVLCPEAIQNELNISILERAFNQGLPTYLLATQYRMDPIIAGFSANYFYQGKLESSIEQKSSLEYPLLFIDTAGANFSETKENEAIFNIYELNFICNHLESLIQDEYNTSIISPYSSQVTKAKELFPQFRVSTIDSFQGQEDESIILSLVRSNSEGNIGFLKDYRRMNVAITRAKKKLIIIGDSSTIGQDEFYNQYLNYIEEVGGYRSVFEFDAIN